MACRQSSQTYYYTTTVAGLVAAQSQLSKEAGLTVHRRLLALVYGQRHAKQEVLKLLAKWLTHL